MGNGKLAYRWWGNPMAQTLCTSVCRFLKKVNCGARAGVPRPPWPPVLCYVRVLPMLPKRRAITSPWGKLEAGGRSLPGPLGTGMRNEFKVMPVSLNTGNCVRRSSTVTRPRGGGLSLQGRLSCSPRHPGLRAQGRLMGL